MLSHIQFCSEAACDTTVSAGTESGWSATLVNGAFAANGVLTLNGSNQFLEFPSGILSSLREYTIACWVNVAAVSYEARIWDFGEDEGNYICFKASQENSGIPAFEARMNYSDKQGISLSHAIPLNKWTHIAISFRQNQVMIYFNGTLNASGPCSIRPSDFAIASRNWIGRSKYRGDSYFTGSISDLRVFERALAAEEVLAISLGNFRYVL